MNQSSKIAECKVRWLEQNFKGKAVIGQYPSCVPPWVFVKQAYKNRNSKYEKLAYEIKVFHMDDVIPGK
jgi:hypothetical protein